MTDKELLQDSEDMVNGRQRKIADDKERFHKLKIFDFESGEKKEFEDRNTNADFDINQVGRKSWAENYFYYFYENKGYKVYNLEKGKRIIFSEEFGWELKNKGVSKITFTENSKMKYDVVSGTPDLLIIGDEEYFFVEVKTGEDGLRTNQLDWIFETDVPVKIASVKIKEKS